MGRGWLPALSALWALPLLEVEVLAPPNGVGPPERNPVRTRASFDLMGHMFSFCWAFVPMGFRSTGPKPSQHVGLDPCMDTGTIIAVLCTGIGGEVCCVGRCSPWSLRGFHNCTKFLPSHSLLPFLSFPFLLLLRPFVPVLFPPLPFSSFSSPTFLILPFPLLPSPEIQP